MLREVWAPVFANYEIAVEAEELLPAGDDRVVVVGRYRGSQRASGEPTDALFAHVLTFEAGRISRLKQITDTASWAPAG